MKSFKQYTSFIKSFRLFTKIQDDKYYIAHQTDDARYFSLLAFYGDEKSYDLIDRNSTFAFNWVAFDPDSGRSTISRIAAFDSKKTARNIIINNRDHMTNLFGPNVYGRVGKSIPYYARTKILSGKEVRTRLVAMRIAKASGYDYNKRDSSKK